MYKVKRFSVDKESIIKDKFIKNLPKSWIINKNDLEIGINDDSNLTDNVILKICKHISTSLIDEIRKYEKGQGEYSMYNEVSNFDDLLKGCYIEGIDVNKRELTVSVGSSKFERWMGWYNVYYSLPDGRFIDIIYND